MPSGSPNQALELTPRSKIQALLNAFDSDDESPKKPADRLPNAFADDTTQSPVVEKTDAGSIPLSHSASSGSESDIILKKPSSGRAARMMGHNETRNAATVSNDEVAKALQMPGRSGVLRSTPISVYPNAAASSASHVPRKPDAPVTRMTLLASIGSLIV